MAGRGRGGRGRGMSLNMEVLGIERNEIHQVTVHQPPALYPPLSFKPVPLASGEDQDYLLTVKQELQNTMRGSPFFVTPPAIKKDIDRYSDRYQLNSSNSKDSQSWQIDWSRFPMELKGLRKKKIPVGTLKPKIVKRTGLSDISIESKLKELESKEAKEDESEDLEGKGSKDDDDDEEKEIDEEELYDEEELEEGTDYNANYFDNGEELDEEEDNLDDGPVY